MYQCQMGKQTMGTPSLAYRKRNDNKLYYITTPQAPLIRTRVYNQYALDDYAMGTNAIVAVLSYTVLMQCSATDVMRNLRSFRATTWRMRWSSIRAQSNVVSVTVRSTPLK